MKCLQKNVDDTAFCNTYNIQSIDPIDETTYDDREKDCYDNLRSYIAKSGLKILHQNHNGLLSKIDMIREVFYSFNKNIHFWGLTESKLTPIVLNAEVEINGYAGILYDVIGLQD